MSWPTAFVLVFGAMPTFLVLLATTCTYPAVMLPLLAALGIAFWFARRQSRRDALAARAVLHHPALARFVAEPLPDMPTVPMRRSA